MDIPTYLPTHPITYTNSNYSKIFDPPFTPPFIMYDYMIYTIYAYPLSHPLSMYQYLPLIIYSADYLHTNIPTHPPTMQ